MLAKFIHSEWANPKRLIMILGLMGLTVSVAFAETAPANEIDWFRLAMGLFGGLSLFLFGMELMSDGLKAAAGEGLKTLLGKLTKNRFMGALTGAFVTAVLNSSSVTTVLVVGFITAGIMTLQQSVGVIMGANIGSTVTAQIIAFNVSQYALLMITVGFAMLFVGKADKTRQYGQMIMGLGLIFFGMGIMSDAMTPLRTYQPFLDLMVRMENPLLGILVGAVFTGLVQSSAATTGIAIVMASEGLIGLPAGIALAFGANIGTCVTAVLAAIGKPPEAVRAAVVHVLFNVFGVLLWVAFIPELAAFVERISPAHPELEGTARMAAEVPRQIANAHTVFNVANTFIFIWFTKPLARLVVRLVPDRPVEEKLIIEPKYLDEELVRTPALALERAQFETARLGDITVEMYKEMGAALRGKDRSALEAVSKRDDEVDVLHEHILRYLGHIRREPLTEQQSDDFVTLTSVVDNLESIADIMETDIAALGSVAIEENLETTPTMSELYEGLYGAVQRALEAAVQSVKENDEKAAQEVVLLKDEVHRMVDEALRHQAAELAGERPERLKQFRLEMEFTDKLKRIYSLSKRIARASLPKELAAKAV